MTTEPSTQPNPQITWTDFTRIDIRIGRILTAEPFPEARKPAYKLTIDFGPLGIRRSSAQITVRYQADELVGKLIVAVVNFQPKRIAGFQSEVLVLGALGENGDVTLLSPTHDVSPGSPIG